MMVLQGLLIILSAIVGTIVGITLLNESKTTHFGLSGVACRLATHDQVAQIWVIFTIVNT